MKILVFSQYFYPENFRINTLCRELVQRGHQVTVVTGYPQYPIGRIYEGYGFDIPYETLWIVITPEGKVKFSMISPYQLGEVSTENTELLHFEAIMNVARATLPLSLQYQERYLAARGQDKVRYTIDRITFGYTRVKQRNNPDECMLVPCWDFFNAEQPDESLLTINAIDGTVIDRSYGY